MMIQSIMENFLKDIIYSKFNINFTGLTPSFCLFTYSVKNFAKSTLLILAESKWFTNIDKPSLVGSFGLIKGACLAAVQASLDLTSKKSDSEWSPIKTSS